MTPAQSPGPVIVTGAMLPLSVQGSDGGRNLLDSLLAAETAPKGVWVQFAGQRMHGARTRKSHSTEFDAFRVNERHIKDCGFVSRTVARTLLCGEWI